MTDHNTNYLFAQTDEEFDAYIASLTDEEMIAYVQRVTSTIAGNPEAFPGVTGQMIEELAAKSEEFQSSVERARRADLEVKISNRLVEHAADELLRGLPDTGKGN